MILQILVAVISLALLSMDIEGQDVESDDSDPSNSMVTIVRSGLVNEITDAIFEESPYISSGAGETADYQIAFGREVFVDHDDPEFGKAKYQNPHDTLNTNDTFEHFPNITDFFFQLAKTGYDSRIRPNLAVKPVEVTSSIFVTSVSSISEVNMDYTIDFYFRQTWSDYRLKWNMEHQEDSSDEAITISGEYFSALWRPDTFFVNEKAASFHRVTGLNSFIRIMPDGHLTQSIRLTIKAWCYMNFQFFPLDDQKCPLYIESYSLPSSDIRYKWVRDKANPSSNKIAAAFASESTSILHFGIHGFRTVETWSMREDGRNHSRLLFELFLDRNLGYYLIQVYVPASLIVVISWISFWIPRHSAPARVTLGVTTILTMVTFTSMGAKAGLPNISYLKAMDVYMMASFVFVFLALVEFAVVSYAEKLAHKTSLLSQIIRSPLVLAPIDTKLNNFERRRCNTWSAFEDMAKRRQSIRVITDDERMTCTCTIAPTLPSRIEWASRFGFPISFVVFNCIYWNYFLRNSSTHDAKGRHGISGYVELK